MEQELMEELIRLRKIMLTASVNLCSWQQSPHLSLQESDRLEKLGLDLRRAVRESETKFVQGVQS